MLSTLGSESAEYDRGVFPLRRSGIPALTLSYNREPSILLMEAGL
jgi:hypothetical protein